MNARSELPVFAGQTGLRRMIVHFYVMLIVFSGPRAIPSDALLSHCMFVFSVLFGFVGVRRASEHCWPHGRFSLRLVL